MKGARNKKGKTAKDRRQMTSTSKPTALCWLGVDCCGCCSHAASTAKSSFFLVEALAFLDWKENERLREDSSCSFSLSLPRRSIMSVPREIEPATRWEKENHGFSEEGEAEEEGTKKRKKKVEGGGEEIDFKGGEDKKKRRRTKIQIYFQMRDTHETNLNGVANLRVLCVEAVAEACAAHLLALGRRLGHLAADAVVLALMCKSTKKC